MTCGDYFTETDKKRKSFNKVIKKRKAKANFLNQKIKNQNNFLKNRN